ncbi:RHS repeat-associated core domain-containing protein [Arthrobacter sp. FX8]|uniref:RHS repeat-associated core domain-containing protein n=1 Tax=Arthrobacter sp. FX8 TaxID=2997335 RepID=UPI00227CFA83|nr:RHS repeat-associated core domain-containing protein [Arthrobacter sp. FX8]WAJ35250.1 RHS repeat-associated core domain-containing protein [Arthrobacter sp. FX8]
MDDKQRIALVETRGDVDDGTPAQAIRYQLTNHLGSASLEVDQQAQIISYEEYAPYGSTTYQAVRSDVEVAAKRYRYTARERDEESGLNYQSTRYYRTDLGRWTAADPAGLVSGENLYVYSRNNPVGFRDPGGMQEENALAPGVGLTFSSRGLTLGPVNQPGYCDELNPSCQGFTIPLTAQNSQVRMSVAIGATGPLTATGNAQGDGSGTPTPAAPPTAPSGVEEGAP